MSEQKKPIYVEYSFLGAVFLISLVILISLSILSSNTSNLPRVVGFSDFSVASFSISSDKFTLLIQNQLPQQIQITDISMNFGPQTKSEVKEFTIRNNPIPGGGITHIEGNLTEPIDQEKSTEVKLTYTYSKGETTYSGSDSGIITFGE